MCGFVALLQSSPIADLEACRSALGSLALRGPDAAGEYRDVGVFLGHRRLSIIDLETGSQPMQSHDGRYVIVFNGEIYNYRELRARLLNQGAKFETQSDTEVILEGYRRWGLDVVDQLRGMFAFVIWDKIRREVFAARDRLGIKPLCWAVHQGRLVIASTLEPFRSLFSDNWQIDLTAVRDLMAFDYVSSPRTIIKGIRKLEPGCCFTWFSGGEVPEIRRYWSPPLPSDSAIVPNENELEQLLDDAIKRQMVADVPLGAFLSGGIDSSLLVAMMARHSSKPVRTFSVKFTGADVDESEVAALVAKKFCTDHTVFHAEDLGPDTLLKIISQLDEPFCDPTLMPTYALAKMTKCQVKVALSGDGADEVFGGYPKYLLKSGSSHAIPMSAFLQKAFRAVPWRPRGASHLYWQTLSSEGQLRFLFARYGDFPIFRKDMKQLITRRFHESTKVEDFFEPWERRAQRYGGKIDTEVIMRTDLETYLSENCLVKTDRASMLASLEVRVPYLDEELLDRVLPLPAHSKIIDGTLKALLVPLAQRLLPERVWNRPKHGFNVPLDRMLAKSWRPAVEATLDWADTNFPLFNSAYLRRLKSINDAEGGIDRELWNPFVLMAWAMTHSIDCGDL